MKYIREVVVETPQDKKTLYISPPDAEGRRLIVQLGYRPSGPGAGFSDFGFVAAEIKGLKVGRVLSVKQLDYSDDSEGFWRKVGRVSSNRRYEP